MKTISFFSYKGGAGRSTLAYNVIPILAKEHIQPTAESPIIVVDTDVDSCGMSYLLKAEKKVTDTNCIQHLLGTPFDGKPTSSIKTHPFLSQLIPVGNAYGYPDNDAILLLPAKDNKNIGKDAKNNYSEAGGPSYMESLKSFLKLCDRAYDIPAVIFDSSVGNTALANISNEAATVIVCVMRPTIQFVNGTHRYWEGVENDEKMLTGDKHIVLVPNVIPQNQVEINGLMYPDTAISKIRDDFTTDFEDSFMNEYHFDMLDPKEFGIPAVDRFMWLEDALYTKNEEDLNDNEKKALGRYRKLARVIADIDADY
jgi:cellulose biosynthesis protein BcsQ